MMVKPPAYDPQKNRWKFEIRQINIKELKLHPSTCEKEGGRNKVKEQMVIKNS